MGDRREREERPWSAFMALAGEPDHKVKRLIVRPGARLSLQRHRERSEHWFVVRGSGLVTRDDALIALGAGGSIDITAGSWHRVANTGAEDLVLIEVQIGFAFREKDIERRADDYGRAG
jgi:mannose-6-phosphate isomerase-like protein (cupin superfamily)